MSKTMFAEVPESDRLRVLLDNCDKKEETSYMKDLTQYELDAKREQLTSNYIAINDLDEELAEIKAGYKQKTEPLKLSNKSFWPRSKPGRRKRKAGFSVSSMPRKESSMYTTKKANSCLPVDCCLVKMPRQNFS